MARGRLTRNIADHGAHEGLLFLCVRIDLYVIEPDRGRGAEFHLADDAVPVGLCPFIDCMRRTDRRQLGVIDQQGDRMFTGCHRTGHIENLGGAERVFPAAKGPIDPHPGVLGTLQEQRNALAFPGARNRHLTPIPGRPFPIPHPREPIDALFVLLNTLSVLVGRAGQLDRVVKLQGKPLFRDADVLGVETKAPRPSQRQRRLVRPGGTGGADALVR